LDGDTHALTDEVLHQHLCILVEVVVHGARGRMREGMHWLKDGIRGRKEKCRGRKEGRRRKEE
jgi:hypothetical protein